jgi:hypothetical protein
MKKVLVLIALLASVVGTTHKAWASDADDLAYFQQFLFQETVDNNDPENPVVSTRYLMSAYDTTKPLPNGDGLNAYAQLLLFPDFTFKVIYQENVFLKDRPGQFVPKGCKELNGSWSVQGGKLMLPGFGQLERALDHGQNGAKWTLTTKVISDEAVGFESIMGFGFSNMTKEQIRCFGF